MRIIRTDPELLREALRLFLVAASFGRAVLREYDGLNRTRSRRRFTAESYEAGLRFLRRFSDAADSDAFGEPLNFLEEEFGRFLGQTPDEVLAALREQTSA